MQYYRITKPDGRQFYRPFNKKTEFLLRRANDLMNEGHKDKIEVIDATLNHLTMEYQNISVVKTLHQGSKSVKSILSEKDAEIARLKDELAALEQLKTETKKRTKKDSDVTE